MIKATFGITHEPFHRKDPKLLPQQQAIFEIIKIHAGHGGFSVVVGEPGLGKSVLREHIEALANERNTIVASFSRTLHTYLNILTQLAEAFKIEAPQRQLEQQLINAAFDHVRAGRTLYVLIDEAHLLDMNNLRKLRLLFDRFPKNHNLILFGQRELLYYLSMTVNQDIKHRITYSAQLLPLNHDDMARFIQDELTAVRLGANTFNESAIDIILRAVQGNLRLARNLCHASLVNACKDGQRSVTSAHVNSVLIQPHWRSHDELIKQQVSA